MKVGELTSKQQAFIEEYLTDLNATQAAIRAGYAESGAAVEGHRLLINANIQTAIAEAMAARSERTEITSDYVVSGIRDVVERCRQHEPVLDKAGDPVMVKTPDGDFAPAYTFQAANALRGLELLGKHLGEFTDKHDVKMSGEVGGQWQVSVVKPQQ